MKVIAIKSFYNNRPRSLILRGASIVKGDGKTGPVPSDNLANMVPIGAVFSIGGTVGTGEDAVETHQPNHPDGQRCPACMEAADNELLMRLKAAECIEIAEDPDGNPTVHVDRTAKEVARLARVAALQAAKQPSVAELMAQLATIQQQLKALQVNQKAA